MAFAAETAAQEIDMATRDANEGAASFVERRSPVAGVPGALTGR
ncbi:hypothetical protein [Streptomyces sp. MMBL 11-1]|nr:hypothetical protein [Streptomyces sp. MMBL 11-1]